MAFKDYFEYRAEGVVYITNPIHGGKVTCEDCEGYVEENTRYSKRPVGDRFVYKCDECFAPSQNV